MGFLSRYVEPIYALMRIVVGFLFLCHGVQKVMMITGGTMPPQMPAPMFYLTTFIEAVGGFLVMIGFQGALAAFICSGTMFFAYVIGHFSQSWGTLAGWLPINNKGELAAIYSWVFLLIAAKGSGIWSVDGARK
jgi:putative oxidoreductase